MTGTQLSPALRIFGKLSGLSMSDRALLLDRATSNDPEIREVTARIIQRVRRDGDRALLELAGELDRVTLESLEVPRRACRNALAQTEPGLRRAMERAAANIELVQRAILPTNIEASPEPGIRIVRRADPLRSVGVYAPGGRAAYPSSVLMGVVPARVAGVEEIVLCSPPDASGLPARVVLAAAELTGAGRVFSIGGAGAIAALAYGTATIPRVDRIVGPGNAWVAAAKLQVADVTGIDSPAGPSELLVIADETASPRVIALEVLAQAEHDPLATVMVIAIGDGVAESVACEIARHLPSQQLEAVIACALRQRGAILTADSIDEAVAFANDFAPEHLLLVCRNAETVSSTLRNAGTVFLGASSSVAYGDYMTGANHVLPTGGSARCFSGLSVLDFFRWTTLQSVDRDGAAGLAEDAGIFADSEGFPAHAAAAREWGRA